jgi:hypothetical protein
MIHWGNDPDRFFSVFSRFGAVVDIRRLKGKKIGHASEVKQLHLVVHDD